MPKKIVREHVASALTIAGSDSGGGAGIQADLKTFAALNVHGTSAITCITAQNPREVRNVEAVTPRIVGDQIDAVWAELPPQGVKTGMLYSAELIAVVVDRLKGKKVTVVVDPVMIATSGARLLKDDAVFALKRDLFPRAALVTPNLDEAEFLLGRKMRTLEEVRQGAREFHAQFGCAALLKGGHLSGREAVDFFFDGDTELMLEAPRITGVSTHGTGCTYSAAIAGYCALGFGVAEAVVKAKTFISNAIALSQRCGKHWVLNPLWNRRSRS